MKRHFKVTASCNTRRVVTASQNSKNKRVAQISIDIVHNGDYDLDKIEDAVADLGFEVVGIDSADVTDSYEF